MKKKFLTVLARCRDEFFIKEWVDYYLSQGVDSIYIIDDDSENKSIYNFAEGGEYDNVHVLYEQRYYANTSTEKQCSLDPDSPSNKLFRDKIKNNYKWLIYCDVDEFIVTKKHFDLTLRERLKLLNKNIRCIAVPWVLMSGAGFQNNPDSILKDITYRHDHDKKHPHNSIKFRCRHKRIEYKSITMTSEIDFLLDHDSRPKIKRHNSINLQTNRVNKTTIEKLRNEDIKNGEFLCYHYRYISDEYAKNKLKTNGWYINDGYTFKDLKSSSYPEVYDDTLVRKIKNNKHIHKE